MKLSAIRLVLLRLFCVMLMAIRFEFQLFLCYAEWNSNRFLTICGVMLFKHRRESVDSSANEVKSIKCALTPNVKIGRWPGAHLTPIVKITPGPFPAPSLTSGVKSPIAGPFLPSHTPKDIWRQTTSHPWTFSRTLHFEIAHSCFF